MKAFMQFFILTFVFFSTMVVEASGFRVDGEYLRPLKANGVDIDYSKTSYRIEGRYLRPLNIGKNTVDHTKNSFRQDGEYLRPLIPGTNRVDYSQ